jgi:hypothetical protein
VVRGAALPALFGAALAAGELDAELRAILRREVGPERVEAELARVLRIWRE